MSLNLTDREIDDLIHEPKQLPVNYKSLVRLIARNGHNGKDLDLAGSNGHDFRLILRQNQNNPMDFSVILAYLVPNTNIVFRLHRYNGRSHQHKNRIEGI